MIGERDRGPAEETLFEKGWFIGIMVAVVVLLGVALWYIASHPGQVAKWVNPDDSGAKTRTVPKPSTSSTN